MSRAAVLPWWARDLLPLAAALAVALAVRLLIASEPMCITGDGVSYIRLARQIAGGGSWYHPIFPPGFSLLIALFNQLAGGSLEAIARNISAVAGSLVLIPAWLLWRQKLGPVAAGFGCGLAAIWPYATHLSGQVLTDPLSLLGVFTGLYAWSRAGWRHTRGWVWGAAAGLCWASVAWMRPETLAWSGVGFVGLLVQGSRRSALLLALVTALVYLPMLLMVHDQTGRWQLAAKQGVNVHKAAAVGSDDFHSRYEQLRDEAASGLTRSAGVVELAKRALANVYLIHRYAVPDAWTPILLMLVGMGAYLGWRQKVEIGWLLLPAAACLPLLFFIVDARILHPLFAVTLGFAGLPFTQLRRWRRWLLLAVCAFLLVPHALRPLYRPHPDAAMREAGLWLAKQGRRELVIIDRKPFVAYYADLPHLWPSPRPGLGGLRSLLAERGKAVVVVDDRYFRTSRPDWFAALSPPPSWLGEMARFHGPNGHVVTLFEYLGHR